MKKMSRNANLPRNVLETVDSVVGHRHTSCVNVQGPHPLHENYEVAVTLCKIYRKHRSDCESGFYTVTAWMKSVEFISYQVHQIYVCTSWGDKHALWSDPSIAFTNFQSRPSHQDFPETLCCLGNMNQSLEFLWVPYVQDSLQIVTNHIKNLQDPIILTSWLTQGTPEDVARNGRPWKLLIFMPLYTLRTKD